MRAWTALFIASLVLLTISIASGSPQQDQAKQVPAKKDATVYSELEQAPEKARVRANPLEKDPEAAAAGRNVFDQHCSSCHGDTAEGSKKAPSLRAPEVQNATPGTLFWLLTNGVVRKGMPVWSRLPEPQRWQLVSYIKSLGTAAADPPPTSKP
jgi:mono/diheme cytochrome c family protein